MSALHNDDSLLISVGPTTDLGQITLSATSFHNDTPFTVTVYSTHPVGKGATATVYKGVARLYNGHAFPVAVKMFHALPDLENKELVRRELHAARNAHHRFILPYTGTSVHGLHSVIISPFMQNGNLLQHLRLNGLSNLQTLILQIAEAVHYLHSVAALVHGDLKCENVLVSDLGNALLADFGLSTLTEKPDTSTTTTTSIRIQHTVNFAAPELLIDNVMQTCSSQNESTVCLRSKSMETDVYAFGMLILQAFTGKPPWPDCTAQAIIRNVNSHIVHPRPNNEVGQYQLKEAWWKVCLKCWMHDPSKRPMMHAVWTELYANLEPLCQTSLGHTSAVFSVDYLPCGTRVVSGSWDSTVRVWDTRSGQAVLGPLRGHRGPVRCVAASPDGREIASCGEDRTVRRWDTDSGAQVGDVMTGHLRCINCIAYSPEGKRLVSGSDDTTLRLWKLSSTAVSHGILLRGHAGSVSSVAFSPSGTCIASGSQDGTIRLWDAHTGGQSRMVTVGQSPMHSICFSPDGTSIASLSGKDELHVWDVATRRSKCTMRGHTEQVRTVSFAPSGKYIASASEDWTIRIWDAETGEPVGDPLRGHTGFVKSVAFSPDGKNIVSGSWDTTVRIWRLFHLEGFKANSLSRDPLHHAISPPTPHLPGIHMFRTFLQYFSSITGFVC